MPSLFVAHHAIERYRERVADISSAEVCAALNSATMRLAADFGARYVRLSGGQRAVIVNGRVVTVLPKDHIAATLSMARDAAFEAEAGFA